VAWPESYSNPAWFNPWPIKYLLPVAKWFPLYFPNGEWEVISFPPAFDEFGNRAAPQPPDGAIIPWWKMPKEFWPIEAPWEPKIFGAWPASKVTMAEDLAPSVWPGKPNVPPFGYIKLMMPEEPDQKGFSIPFYHMRMHMRPDFGPIHHMKIMTRVNALGETKFYMIGKNWDQYEYDYREYRAALKARKHERVIQMLAEEIVRTKGQPKPSKDLFA
jgi:hypothetical protein